jgi:hypothetical protein
MTARDGSAAAGVRPTMRRAADRHYMAVVAAEIHRLALQLGPTRDAQTTILSGSHRAQR